MKYEVRASNFGFAFFFKLSNPCCVIKWQSREYHIILVRVS